MKWIPTYHRDGSITIRLKPETPKEREDLNGIMFSRPPGGTLIEWGKARIECPVMTKDGQEWGREEYSIGDAKLKDGVFTRRLALGYEEKENQ